MKPFGQRALGQSLAAFFFSQPAGESNPMRNAVVIMASVTAQSCDLGIRYFDPNGALILGFRSGDIAVKPEEEIQ